MPTSVRSHAKVNLGLYLGAPRADGFHGLVTAYQTLEIHDIVTVTAAPASHTSLRLTSNDPRVPTDERNTAWKIVLLVLEEMGVEASVHIVIEKRLPIQGGLGAGSGNAVAALVGLEEELELASQRGSRSAGRRRFDPSSPHWLEIAAKVGSDVPLFLIGGTVLGLDRGQQVSPLADIEPIWCAVAVPEVGISTPQAFRDWDALCVAEGLTAEASADKLKTLSRTYVAAFSDESGRLGKVGSSGVFSKGEDLAGLQEPALVRTGITSWIENDFERVVFRQHPSLAEIKRLLAAAGTPEAALFASLSGSGSALFGLYQARGDAQAAADRVQRQFPAVKVQITRTLPRKTYWEKMIVENSR
jgi:4-diphosphocytidyl-2-C-methyl-D-erythritol kinase